MMRSQSGFSLVELLAAITLFSLIITGFVKIQPDLIEGESADDGNTIIGLLSPEDYLVSYSFKLIFWKIFVLNLNLLNTEYIRIFHLKPFYKTLFTNSPDTVDIP